MPTSAREFHRLAAERGHDLQADRPLPWLTRHGHFSAGVERTLPAEACALLRRIFAALDGDEAALRAKIRGHMTADFLLHGREVEYDERQHFTPARLVTLDLYDDGGALGFDLDEYRDLCRAWQVRAGRDYAHRAAVEFPGDAGRQRQRAYFDAFRDVAAPAFGNGPVLRVPAPERDAALALKRFEAGLHRSPSD